MTEPPCCCHSFLRNGHCLSSEDGQDCVLFASLVKYEHLEVVPVPRGAISKIWNRAFQKHSKSKQYPLYLMIKDLFHDDDKAQHEANLALQFQKYTRPDN